MEIGSKSYTIGKMPVPVQYHVMRRILPAIMTLPELLGALDAFREKPNAGALVGAALPLARALAGMSDEDSNFIITHCLSAVRRDEGGRQAQITTGKGALMYADIDLAAMLALTVAVLRENLGGFFPEIMALAMGATPDTSSTSA